MSDAITTTVAGEVRAELARQNVPQRMVADALGMSQAAAWRRLRGDVPFDISELARVADLLNVPLARFLPTAASDTPPPGTPGPSGPPPGPRGPSPSSPGHDPAHPRPPAPKPPRVEQVRGAA